jgi:hypothetical protein
MARNMVQYLHFRILKFPLILNENKGSIFLQAPPCMGLTEHLVLDIHGCITSIFLLVKSQCLMEKSLHWLVKSLNVFLCDISKCKYHVGLWYHTWYPYHIPSCIDVSPFYPIRNQVFSLNDPPVVPYTLWKTKIAIEHGHRNSWFTYWRWWFSSSLC